MVDPRRSRTAEVADEHLPIRPGTDAALLAGIAHVLFADGLVAPGPVEHLGLHNVVADCLVGACRGATSPGEEFPVRCVTQSTADYGLGGYGIHLVPPLVTYVGREAVDVAAGTFQGLHFRVRWSDQVPKYSDFWVSDDFVPLRLLGASGDVSYELFELDGSL